MQYFSIIIEKVLPKTAMAIQLNWSNKQKVRPLWMHVLSTVFTFGQTNCPLSAGQFACVFIISFTSFCYIRSSTWLAVLKPKWTQK